MIRTGIPPARQMIGESEARGRVHGQRRAAVNKRSSDGRINVAGV